MAAAAGNGTWACSVDDIKQLRSVGMPPVASKPATKVIAIVHKVVSIDLKALAPISAIDGDRFPGSIVDRIAQVNAEGNSRTCQVVHLCIIEIPIDGVGTLRCQHRITSTRAGMEGLYIEIIVRGIGGASHQLERA